MTLHTGNKRLLWQQLTTMVIDKICKMSIKGVKLKLESFFSISRGVLELWRKNLRRGGFRPPGPDRVKPVWIRALLSSAITLSLRDRALGIKTY